MNLLLIGTFYRIRQISTGLWSGGGMPATYKKVPKVWAARGHIVNHLVGNLYWSPKEGSPYRIGSGRNHLPSDIWRNRKISEAAKIAMGIEMGVVTGHEDIEVVVTDGNVDTVYTILDFLKKADLVR